MTHTLFPRTASARFGLAQGIRALPYASFTLVIAVVVTCGVGIANMPASWANAAEGPSVDADAPAAAAALPSAAAAVAVAVRGVVQSIRPLEPVADQPAQFEFTVRLRDGSTRVSRTVGRAKWHSGDRIFLMGGAGASRD
jgi:hypothetical protein